MPAHSYLSIQSSSRRSTCDRAKLIFRSACAVALALSIVAGLEGSFASGLGIGRAGGAARQVINRMQKGDRLRGASAFQLTVLKKLNAVTTRRLPTVNLKLPEGCEPLVSPIANDWLA